MQILRGAMTFTIALLACACSTTRVATDYDHRADFGGYTTYAWHQGIEDDHGPTEGPSQLVAQRIRDAISQNLLVKGLKPYQAGEADLLVTYYTSLDSQMHFHTASWGYGYGWGWGPYWNYGYGPWPGWTSTTVHTFHEGTIIIDVIDREKKQLVWRGVGTAALSKKSHSQEKIERSVTRILEGFPPA